MRPVPADARVDLDTLAEDAAACRACGLCATRTQAVFGSGDPHADLMIVGEAPGRNEDIQGVPFVGAGGKLLDRMLGEIGLARDDVYVANIVKCRPPDNRDPQPAEIAACTHFLDRQIALVAPLVVCTVGNFATRYLLETTAGITRLRGTCHPFRRGAVLVPTFHPAAVLRGGQSKQADMRADFDLVRATLDRARDRRDRTAAFDGVASDEAAEPGDARDAASREVREGGAAPADGGRTARHRGTSRP